MFFFSRSRKRFVRLYIKIEHTYVHDIFFLRAHMFRILAWKSTRSFSSSYIYDHDRIQNSDAHTCVMMVLIVLIIPYFNLSKRVSCMLLHQLI